ncbi:hypothetical protein GCM10011579_001220 [Streptomyces albiflavescens]|uniref:Uncharacterized protein n=1 Tax=Streptomyces albiflavescens TaxID=1623582 RepID=A0A917XQI1_9ACTN|nr:hypothetical protein GCM10011579_001220 [Streptomyces albiflavescens]
MAKRLGDRIRSYTGAAGGRRGHGQDLESVNTDRRALSNKSAANHGTEGHATDLR